MQAAYQHEAVPSTTSERRLCVSFFSSAYDNRPKIEALTAAELAQRCSSRRFLDDVPADDERKRAGPAFSPVRYKIGTTRAKGNAVVVSAYVIDLDGLDAKTVQAVWRNLKGLGVLAFGWTTWSHGWAKPGECWRIVVPFAVDVDASRWTALWPVLNERIALGHSDPSTKDASRLHFFGRLPRRVPRDGVLVENDGSDWRSVEGELFDPTPLLDELDRRASAPPTDAPRATTPAAPVDRGGVGVQERARRYLQAVDGAVSGQGGHNATLRAASALVNGFALSVDDARPLLHEWNARCVPPWSEAELDHKLTDAEKAGHYNGRQRGCLLEERGQLSPALPRGEEPEDLTPEAPRARERPRLSDKAFHGPLGEIVRAVEPSTEADPCAILVHLLAGVGMLAGRTRWRFAGGMEHHGRLFVCVVGDTATARKGTSWQVARRVLEKVSESFGENVLSGIGSGEGLIDAVRDAVTEQVLSRKSNSYEAVERPGVLDKRLLLVQQEFGRVLAIAERKGDTLSTIMREAWDGGTLVVRTRTNPICATNPHVACVAHITADELRLRLATVDLFDGFANRFSFHLVGRDKHLPFGAPLEVPSEPVEAIRRAIFEPSYEGAFEIEGEARDLWDAAYAEFGKPIAGPVGAALGRRDAIALRIALIYAICDDADGIRLPHLEAALALVEHAEASARALFGESTGDRVADRLRAALRAAGAGGLSRSQLSAELGRNTPKDALDAALLALEGAGHARRERRQGAKGAPCEVWFAM